MRAQSPAAKKRTNKARRANPAPEKQRRSGWAGKLVFFLFLGVIVCIATLIYQTADTINHIFISANTAPASTTSNPNIKQPPPAVLSQLKDPDEQENTPAATTTAVTGQSSGGVMNGNAQNGATASRSGHNTQSQTATANEAGTTPSPSPTVEKSSGVTKLSEPNTGNSTTAQGSDQEEKSASIHPPALSTGSRRITVLLLGVDKRDSEPMDGTRSDTMILLTLDPATMTGGMLSIPRDLLVPIPGNTPNKINVAHAIGGPVLAKQTVEKAFGIKVDYFVRINFTGFEQIINTVGGVTIDVPRPIRDEQYPLGDTNEERRLYIPAGLQHMDGNMALMYARTRHSDGDLNRMKRQQQLIWAVRDQAMHMNIIQHLPDLLSQLRMTVQTDLPIGDIPGLIDLARQINTANIATRSFDETTFTESNTADGYYLIPRWGPIREMVRQIFAAPPQLNQSTAITIQAGSGDQMLAQALAERLHSLGFQSVNVQLMEPTPGSETMIYDDGYHSGTSAYLAQAIGLQTSAIRIRMFDSLSGITIRIGQFHPNWVAQNMGAPASITQP